MPYGYSATLIVLGIFMFVQANFIISISHDTYLWWQVIHAIDKSPYNLIISYGMVFLSFGFIVVGVWQMITKDRKSGE